MLETIDLSAKLKKKEYRKRLQPLQLRAHRLQRAARDAGMGTIVVFEGLEACGKGDVIGKMTRRLEPRAAQVHSVRAPRSYIRPLPWLYRFWVATPAWGTIGVFDNSWYRRVLREYVDGEVSSAQRDDAFSTIRSFERTLADNGYEIVKFFLHISQEEQRTRLEAREADDTPEWLVTAEQWRRHEQYRELVAAVETMLAETETDVGPWNVVSATNARWARVATLEALIDRMECGLARRGVDVPALLEG